MTSKEQSQPCAWEKEELIQLRQLFLTQIKIHSDWDWNKVKQDLKLITKVLGIKFEPVQEPNEEIIKSGLLSFQPNRSIQPLTQLLSELLDSVQRPIDRCPSRVYPPSVLVPAQFLLDHVLPHINQRPSNLNQLIDCFYFQATVFLPKILLKLISEFSRVYRARLMINKICASEFACNKLTQWHQSTSTVKSSNFFDDERDQYEEAYKLFEHELSRGNSN